MYVTVEGRHLLIDTSIDLRQQCLTYALPRVDAVLFTHHHVDHIFGLDDLRVYNALQKTKIPCYGSPETIANIRHIYSYVFEHPDLPGGIPQIDLLPVEASFEALGVFVTPIPILHGPMPIYAYRIGNFVYATDCSAIPAASEALLRDVDVLVLDCLRRKPHPTHFHVEAAVDVARRIGARATYFTHMSHDIEHATVSRDLPAGIFLAYDGLELTSS